MKQIPKEFYDYLGVVGKHNTYAYHPKFGWFKKNNGRWWKFRWARPQSEWMMGRRMRKIRLRFGEAKK